MALLAWAVPDAELQLEAKNRVPPPATPPERLRLVTFNVHTASKLSRLIEDIRAHPDLQAADVLLLQEMESYETEGASRTAKLAEALEMSYVYAPARATERGGTHGLAILSRFPLLDVEVLPLKQFDLRYNTRRRIALAATVEVDGRRLRIYNLHLDTRLNPKDRLAQLRPVVEAALAQPVAQVVIGGDFNTNAFRWLFRVVPVFYSNQAGAVDALMQEKGFAAPFSDSGSTIRKALLRLRLDSLYARELSIGDTGVERNVAASDHYPVWMDVQWQTTASAE